MVSSYELWIQIIIVFLTFVVSLIKNKLTIGGAIAALFIGGCVVLSGFEYMMIMMMFFVSANIATSYNWTIKEKLVRATINDKSRNAVQVLCKGLYPSFISFLIFWFYDGELDLNTPYKIRQILQGMYIAFYSFATADTWASEIGMCDKNNPYLITTFKFVPKGTNGGISKIGTIMSVLGGGFIALVSVLSYAFRYGAYEIEYTIIIRMIIYGMFWGFIGSIIDSLLGATMQLTVYDPISKAIVNKEQQNEECWIFGRDILNNSQINLISGIATSIIAAMMLLFK